ncbi:MAG TPA: F0F1 ATP synthase subunit epsilon [Candidatus Absconditabacterales bacterium]|nr:F0F1 ATP synthase subunit epsilon [Candidatus Absconditabacterales bacterium]
MKLKISTPAKVIFEGEIEKTSIPTETENLKVMEGHPPMVTSVKPGIIKIWPMKNNIQVGDEIYVSTSKGMVFIDGKIIRIVSAEATLAPEESENILLQNKKNLEEKIKRLKTEGSIEEIEKALIKLEKIHADIELKRMLQTA